MDKILLPQYVYVVLDKIGMTTSGVYVTEAKAREIVAQDPDLTYIKTMVHYS